MNNHTKIRPLLTIITVVLNNAAHLQATIKSVTQQTYKNIEYIIIDGGSTDGTVDIIKKHNEYISKWISEKDLGIYDAMNKGIKLANGKYINFLNAGDTLLKNDICSQLAKIIVHNPKQESIYLLSLQRSDGKIVKPVLPNLLRHYRLPTYHQGIIYPYTSLTNYPYPIHYKMVGDFHQFFTISRLFPICRLPITWCIYDMSGISSVNKKALHDEFAIAYTELGICRCLYYFRKIRAFINI
jgi:glycosyltransferase involved in cell wall biosynthesis